MQGPRVLFSPRKKDPGSFFSLLIHGGRVIDPASGLDEAADVLIAGGLIREIGRVAAPPGAARLDASGCIVAPGLIDVHVHFREPHPEHDETVRSGSASAINGGFTAVCCMPNTRPPLDSADAVERVRRAGEAAGGARVFVAGCATAGRAGRVPGPIAALRAAGAVAFTDDGDCVSDGAVLEQVLRAVRGADACFMQHCQDPALAGDGQMNAGPLADRLGLAGWPAAAEETIIERDIALNRDIGCRYHAQHLSSGGSAALIRAARAAGRPVTAEVTPHHLLLTEELCDGGNTAAKVNPPLRARGDIDGLKAAVADGTITVLATDHAPHPARRKQVPFPQAAFGIVGLDCALALYLKALVEDGVIGLAPMLAMMTCNPAALIGADRLGLGRLAEGGPADVTVIDPGHEWTIRAADFATTGRNCPFEGWTVRGRAMAAMVGGEVRLLRDRGRAGAGLEDAVPGR
jgi:dihydroorotase